MLCKHLQFFSHHMRGGSTSNGRNSAGRRLGSKRADGQFVCAGNILYRQRGLCIHPGANVGRGGEALLFATAAGVVCFERFGRACCCVSVYPAAAAAYA